MTDEPGCECCGLDRPWVMVTDSTGHTVALCAECIDVLTTMADVSPPDSPDGIPPVVALGGAIGRLATVACRQAAHDLCRDPGCGCRCHE